MKGLMVSVHGSDCTNRGVTSGVEHVVLVGDGIGEVFEDREGMPAVGLEYDLEPSGMQAGQLAVAKPRWLEALGLIRAMGDFEAIRNPVSYSEQHRIVNVVARPFNEDGELRQGGMFGGNYISTSDSRFPTTAPIPVHDRFE